MSSDDASRALQLFLSGHSVNSVVYVMGYKPTLDEVNKVIRLRLLEAMKVEEMHNVNHP